MRPTIIKPALIGLLVGSLTVGALSAYEGFVTRDPNWIEQARETKLTPCFYNMVMTRLYWEEHAQQYEMTYAEKAELYGAARVIDSGTHKDVVVPEECFAVATGLYGFNITFWQRPRIDGQYDMSIPYWTPAPDQMSAASYTTDEVSQP
tara:strand:- start:962 stop:1408 length:447 start_codon:yes stop_codon:yes gene_type:complete